MKAQKAIDNPVGDAGPVKGVGQLRNRTGATVGEPFSGCCFFIVNPGGGLQIQDNRHCLTDLMNRKNRSTGYISTAVCQNQIHMVGDKIFTGFMAFLLTVNQTIIINGCPHGFYLGCNKFAIG